MQENNIILVGKKDFMSYIRSIELLLRKKKLEKVILKARGKNIKTAVDLAEASKHKFLDDLNIVLGNVKTCTETFNDRGKELSVSGIEIEIISK